MDRNKESFIGRSAGFYVVSWKNGLEKMDTWIIKTHNQEIELIDLKF